MTITSKGYTGSVNYADWAVLTSHLSAQYTVFGADAFKVGPGPGDRGISIAAGTGAGQGILDISDAIETLAGGPVASGSRWDLIALRRDWGAKKTIPVLIPGSALRALPTRQQVVGTRDDHPLALVRFDAGQTVPGAFVDLRVWAGDGGVVGGDLLVRDFLDRIGTRILISGVEWSRDLDGTGQATWRALGEPVGVVAPFVGTTAPAGWLMCAGQSVPRTSYPQLFAILGTRFGGEGSQNFTLPNMSGRVPVGVASGDAEFGDIGRVGGAKTHTLTAGQMPRHSHYIDGPLGGQLSGTNGAGSGGNSAGFSPWFGGGFGAQPGGVTAAGGDEPHNNLQPYIALNYIIRAL